MPDRVGFLTHTPRLRVPKPPLRPLSLRRLIEVKNKYPDKSIDMIGHSLGAAVAEDLGNDPRVKNVITLNKPTTPYDLIKKSKINDRQYVIRTTKDLVSMLQQFQKDKE
jgi:hypothetical protein